MQLDAVRAELTVGSPPDSAVPMGGGFTCTACRGPPVTNTVLAGWAATEVHESTTDSPRMHKLSLARDVASQANPYASLQVAAAVPSPEPEVASNAPSTAKAQPKAVTPKRQKASGRDKGAPPAMLVCYICGRQFGSSSLSIHEPQCIKKWEAENANLPPEQRRKRPKKPEAVGGGGGAASSVDAANEVAYAAYESNQSPCPNCGRTFNADRLPVHLRSCKAGSKNAASNRRA